MNKFARLRLPRPLRSVNRRCTRQVLGFLEDPQPYDSGSLLIVAVKEPGHRAAIALLVEKVYGSKDPYETGVEAIKS